MWKLMNYYTCVLIIILNNLCTNADTGCVSPVALLEGRRRIDGVIFRASSSASSHAASEARLSDNGWCSDQLGGDLSDPFLQVNFGINILFTSIVTNYASLTALNKIYLERYQVELAREGSQFLYLAKPNSSQVERAIFPLEVDEISSARQYTEHLPIPVIGQALRIDPYKWNDYDNVCTRLEVFGCPSQECQRENQLGSNSVTMVTVNGEQINYNDLFDFSTDADRYCVPTDTNPPTITISYSSSVLLTEIGIQGIQVLFPFRNRFVRSFSLSYDAGNDTVSYISANGLTTFSVSDAQAYYFGLWPPIKTTKLKITIHDWQSDPCLNFWVSGCLSSDVVEHSIDPSAPMAGLVDNSHVTVTTTETVVLSTTTVVVTSTVMSSPSSSATVVVTSTVTSSPSKSVVTSTVTKSPSSSSSATTVVTTTVTSLPSKSVVTSTVTNSPSSSSSATTVVTTTVTSLPSKSTPLRPTSTQNPSPGSGVICSQNSDDYDNTPIYISIAIVLVGVLATTVIVIVGVIMCRRHSHSQMKPANSSDPLMPRSYGSINPSTAAVGVENDLYGRPELQRRRVGDDSDDEPLSLNNEPPSNGTNNPTYGLHGSDHSNIYAEPTQ